MNPEALNRARMFDAERLVKVNMSELASGGPMSSVRGATYNPHDTGRSPSGSSGGTGAAVAAGCAPLVIGTYKGGSVLGPSAAKGLVGFKPTMGLLSRDLIVPAGFTGRGLPVADDPAR